MEIEKKHWNTGNPMPNPFLLPIQPQASGSPSQGDEYDKSGP